MTYEDYSQKRRERMDDEGKEALEVFTHAFRKYDPNTETLDDWAANMAYPAEDAMLARAERVPGETVVVEPLTQEEMIAAYMEDDMETCGEHGINEPTCDICDKGQCFTPDMEWNGETGNHVECETK